jgi:hypothetical protein
MIEANAWFSDDNKAESNGTSNQSQIERLQCVQLTAKTGGVTVSYPMQRE